MAKQIKMLVIACNTATAAALPALRQQLSIPVIGVIAPGSRAALKASHRNRIGVIATEGTIRSNAYRDAILTKDPTATVISQACPKFVPLVESNEYQSTVAKRVVAESLKQLKTRCRYACLRLHALSIIAATHSKCDGTRGDLD